MASIRLVASEVNDQEEIKSAKQHTRDVFAWLDQVMADPGLPPSAKTVAYAIGQHINRQSGEAFPSTDRIAACIAMSQATVIEMVRRLEAAGHLGVDPGSPGRGHSNRYRMIRKPQFAEVSGSSKPQPAKVSAKLRKPQPAELKPQPAEIKPQPADMNHFNNNLSNHQEAGRSRPAVLVDRAVTESRETSFSKLKRCYPSNHIGDEAKAFTAFQLALDAGHRLVEMIQSAIEITLAANNGGDDIPQLEQFLLSKCWRETNQPSALNALH